MTISVFNTKEGKKVIFEPRTPGHVKMYVCGITAYDYCHIGHARSVLAFDMIYRYFKYRGYEVTYVRNFTDIDDKIIRRAQEQSISPEELAERFIDKFNEDMTALGVLKPTIEPKATEHLAEIIAMIETLVAKGLAYEAGGDVYYIIEGFSRYGQLSKRSLEEMQAGARVEINESKKNPMDFALWKASKPGEPAWESPWGPGRPGWHIECSAMSRKYLGDTFDIHGGGKDLVFPHHENEIAQSEGATGKPFANTWIHHGFVNIQDEKMSKSLGNFLTIRDVLGRFSAETLRLFIYSTHYRSPLNYSEEAMQDAAAALDRLYSNQADIARLPVNGMPAGKGRASGKDRDKIISLVARGQEAMDNDFNSAQALGHIFEAVKILNTILRSLPAAPAQADLELLHAGAAGIREIAGIMGLLGEDPVAYVERKQQAHLDALGMSRDELDSLIRQRTEARARKDWAASDAIRDQLLAKNIELMDSTDGTGWQVKG